MKVKKLTANLKKSKVKKSVLKSDIEALKGTTGLRDNPLHNEIGYLKSIKTLSKKPAAKVFKNIMKSDMAKDVKNTMNSCVDSTGCLINNATEVSNFTTNCATDLLTKYAGFVGSFLKQNMDAGQNLLNCKNADDTLKFQQKLFKDNLSSIINVSMDMVQAVQKFTGKNFESALDCADKNVRCFTRFGN